MAAKNDKSSDNETSRESASTTSSDRTGTAPVRPEYDRPGVAPVAAEGKAPVKSERQDKPKDGEDAQDDVARGRLTVDSAPAYRPYPEYQVVLEGQDEGDGASKPGGRR